MTIFGARRNVVKWVRRDLTTRDGYDWSVPGKVHRFSGKGPLCSDGHAHVYASAPLALWLRPLHVDLSYCRLIPGTGIVSSTDGLKLGVRELVLDHDHELVLPPDAPRPAALVAAAITASLVVAGDDAAYRQWAAAWLDGRDRTAESAREVARAAAVRVAKAEAVAAEATTEATWMAVAAETAMDEDARAAWAAWAVTAAAAVEATRTAVLAVETAVLATEFTEAEAKAMSTVQWAASPARAWSAEAWATAWATAAPSAAWAVGKAAAVTAAAAVKAKKGRALDLEAIAAAAHIL